MKNWFTLILALAVSPHALTVPTYISIGHLSYSGDGCPPGSANVNLNNDGAQLDIRFGNFMAQAGPSTGRNMGRKTCTINIPVQVPPQSQFSILQAEYRGYNQLPDGAQSQLEIDTFFAGERGPQVKRAFAGALNAAFAFNEPIRPQTQKWSPCGQNAILRLSANLQVSNSNRQQEATLSIDKSGGLFYALEWRRCR